MVFENHPTVHSGGVTRGGSVAVAVCVSDRWHMTLDLERWHMTQDTGHMTHGRWQVPGDRWQVTWDRWHINLIFFVPNFFRFLWVSVLLTAPPRDWISPGFFLHTVQNWKLNKSLHCYLHCYMIWNFCLHQTSFILFTWSMQSKNINIRNIYIYVDLSSFMSKWPLVNNWTAWQSNSLCDIEFIIKNIADLRHWSYRSVQIVALIQTNIYIFLFNQVSRVTCHLSPVTCH